VVEHGRRAERQGGIFDAWRAAIAAGRYSGLLCDTASEEAARWLTQLVFEADLAPSTFALDTSCWP
jgi:hypothetical protein